VEIQISNRNDEYIKPLIWSQLPRLSWSYDQYGKLGRYFRTSSSAQWGRRLTNSVFHLFIQFQWEKLLFLHWNRINRWKIEFLDLFSDLVKIEILKYLPSFPYWSYVRSLEINYQKVFVYLRSVPTAQRLLCWSTVSDSSISDPTVTISSDYAASLTYLKLVDFVKIIVPYFQW